MSAYTAEDVLSYVKKWSKPAQLKNLKTTEGVKEFYDDIEYGGKRANVRFLTPFFNKVIEPAFNPKKVSIKEFVPFIKGIAKMLDANIDIKTNMDTYFKAKAFIKENLAFYHEADVEDRDHSNLYVKAWYDAKLNVLKPEFLIKRTNAEKKVDEKNRNVLHIPLEKVEKFYDLFCYKESPDLIDNIITVQATMGLRLIEALSSNVSNFNIVPKSDMIEQKGTAKLLKNKYSIDDKVVEKRPIKITPQRFMDKLKIVRTETDKYLDLTNIKMREKYNVAVNDRIQKYLTEADIPKHNELKSSHGLRRLYVAYAFSLRNEPNMTLHAFIKQNLGHESSGSTQNYNTINITTDRILDKDTATVINSTHRATVNLQEEIEGLKQEISDIQHTPASQVLQTARDIELNNQSVATKNKFAKITKAISQGKTSYSQMESIGITAHMYSKYKKLHPASL
jgi:uncharacterized membrane protein YcgQ (UPF0703/DUF1980 family)